MFSHSFQRFRSKFNVLREQLCRKYQNAGVKSRVACENLRKALVLPTAYFRDQDKRKVVQDDLKTPEDILDFLDRMKAGGVKLEVFISGSSTASGAQDIVKSIESLLDDWLITDAKIFESENKRRKTATDPATAELSFSSPSVLLDNVDAEEFKIAKKAHYDYFPAMPCRKLHSGHHLLRMEFSQDQSETNNIVEMYFQIGPFDNWRQRALLSLAEEIMYEPLYDYIRTKHQTGYAVGIGVRNSGQILGIAVKVQSATCGPAVIFERVEAFFRKFRAAIKTMSDRKGRCTFIFPRPIQPSRIVMCRDEDGTIPNPL
jgi:secreted Zn-dependent insulinase-like peptidase